MADRGAEAGIAVGGGGVEKLRELMWRVCREGREMM